MPGKSLSDGEGETTQLHIRPKEWAASSEQRPIRCPDTGVRSMVVSRGKSRTPRGRKPAETVSLRGLVAVAGVAAAFLGVPSAVADYLTARANLAAATRQADSAERIACLELQRAGLKPPEWCPRQRQSTTRGHDRRTRSRAMPR